MESGTFSGDFMAKLLIGLFGYFKYRSFSTKPLDKLRMYTY